MAISARMPRNPVTPSAESPSIGARPSSSRPSSVKNSMAASMSSTTMPTLSIRLTVMMSPWRQTAYELDRPLKTDRVAVRILKPKLSHAIWGCRGRFERDADLPEMLESVVEIAAPKEKTCVAMRSLAAGAECGGALVKVKGRVEHQFSVADAE